MPSVSVLLPVYNAATTLGECIDSILQQTLDDFELLVIDDHSSDDSVALIQSYADERIKLVRNPLKGLVSALNYGLAQALTDFIARMDADDIMRPQRLQKQLFYMQAHPELALVSSQVKKFPKKILKSGYIEYMRWQNACISREEIASQIYIESPLAHPSVMFKKSIINAVGGYRDGDFPEDYDLWLRLHHAGYSMEKIPQILLEWRESAGRLSRISSAYRREAFDSLRAQYLAKDPRIQRRDIVYWGAGRNTRKRSMHLINKGFKPFAWIDVDPKKIGNVIDGACVEEPGWLDREQKPFVLSYVTNHGARNRVREFLDEKGYRMGCDYLEVG